MERHDRKPESAHEAQKPEERQEERQEEKVLPPIIFAYVPPRTEKTKEAIEAIKERLKRDIERNW